MPTVCKIECGGCEKFTKVDHKEGDLTELRKEVKESSESLLSNSNVTDPELRARLQHNIDTNDSVFFGTVPEACNSVGGLVASNRICIKEVVGVL